MPTHPHASLYNPYIHGTSSQTLSMMRHTDFQLMPIIAMLQDFKIAPMVGELTEGGFDIIGDGSNKDTITGAPAFGSMQHHLYNLNTILNSYTKFPANTSLDACTENFQRSLKYSHNSAFTRLNLLMIYLVRLRQFGVKIADVAPLEEINILKKRLDATIQFYYFILCVQKYIFIDAAEIECFEKESNPDGEYIVGVEHYFSFENFLEKLGKSKFNVEEIYNSPSPENIAKLIEFVKISKDTQEKVKRYPTGEHNFTAKRDYHFFTPNKPEPGGRVIYTKISEHLFDNASGCSLAHYLERHQHAYSLLQGGKDAATFPDFEGFHTKVLPYIEAMKDRVQLCNSLLDADDNEFVPYDKKDGLIIKPFPVVFVTEAETLEVDFDEYRSRTPLKLGKEIRLVATDNKNNQEQLRDYIQKNNVGPVEVLLFDDLRTLGSKPANYFDAFANDDLIKAFELAKKQNCATQFSKLYRALSELNEKRYRFKSTNLEMYNILDNLFTDLQQNLLTPDKDKINFKGIQDVLQRHKQEHYALYATHRGILGVIDTLLTILASLVVFYPITYLVQKSRNSVHTFFATDTGKKINYALYAADEAMNQNI